MTDRLTKGNLSWKFEAFTPQQERIFCVEANLCLDRSEDDPRNADACPPVRERVGYVGDLQQALGKK